MSRLDLTRRHFLRESALGVGSLGLWSLLARDGLASPLEDGLPVGPHFAPKAKRVIYLHMAGSPSQLDLFDPKPELVKHDREPCPDELFANERFAFIKGRPNLLGSPHRFAPRGESGQQISDLLPHLAGVADDLTIVRGLWTEQFNHAPAQIFMNSGHFRIGRPSFGSWVTYGLGTENRDLPGFVVLISGRYGPSGGSSCWTNGFLPSVYQGVRFRSEGDAVLFLSDPDGMERATRRRSLDAIRALNERHRERAGDPEIDTRIAQYEMAYRMQTSVPELLDIDSEPESVREMYGVEPGKVSFANNALLARRLCERGVRFVQLYHWGWDSHGTSADNDLVEGLPMRCKEVDQASAALVTDLKQRGLLEDTIIVWGGEFGRTPMNEERDGSTFLGRDHHPHAFTMWLAGGGLRPGVTVGATDELGYHAVEDKMSVHDLHATLLHQLGFDHERLTYRSQGRDFRLTDVSGTVVDKLLA